MIPFLDLNAQYLALQGELEEAVIGCMRSTHYVLGPKVEAFEKEFAAFCGTAHAVGLNSGTSALVVAFLAAGIGPGDEVITVANTFVATVAAIELVGAHPVLVDVDPVTWNLAPDGLAAAITSRTRAIVPVHLHGLVADMAPIMEIARRHNLVVIEDAAQAHGGTDKGRRAGAIGDIGCFSFYPGKNLGALGEAGAVVTANPDLAQKCRMIRDWGQVKKYDHAIKGYNFRMEGIQGAALSVKLRHLNDWIEARRRHAREYDRLLDGTGVAHSANPSDSRHVYHVYAILMDDRDATQAHLQRHGIGTGIHYPVPVHLQKSFANLGYKPGDFPVSEALCGRLLSLPMFPELTTEQISEVCARVEEAFASP